MSSSHKRRHSGDGYGNIQLEVLNSEDDAASGYDMKRHNSGSRKKTLACVLLLVLILTAFAVFLFVVFVGVDETKDELHQLEAKLKGEGDTNINNLFFNGGVAGCNQPSYERYLLVTGNYASINASGQDGHSLVHADRLPPGFLAVVDINPESKKYSKVVSSVELNFNGRDSRQPRRGTQYGHYYIIGDAHPAYSDIYIVDIKKPTSPKLHAVVSGDAIRSSYELGAPNTIRTLQDGTLLIAMMSNGDESGAGKGGFLQLDPEDDFSVLRRWDSNSSGQDPLNDLRKANYDFWLSPYIQNTMVSSEWLPAKSQQGKGSAEEDIDSLSKSSTYINFWNLALRSIAFRVNLHGEARRDVQSHMPNGYMPLEVRMLHKNQALGYVAVAGNGEVIAFWRVFSAWETLAVIQVDPKLNESNPTDISAAIPALLTDIIISADDSRLYLANWAHGEIRQYNIEDPLSPLLCSTVQVSSGYDNMHGSSSNFKNAATGRKVEGGPARLQLRNDGSELFYSTSFTPGWDNDFYPQMTKSGSFIGKIKIDSCSCKGSSMKIDDSFGVDFGDSKKFPDNPSVLPARAHDLHFVGGDPSTYPSMYIPTPTPPPSSVSSS